MRRLFDISEVDAGFHMTTLPMIAGAAGRFPAIAVKLKGVVAKMNPSSGLYSSLFNVPGDASGWSE